MPEKCQTQAVSASVPKPVQDSASKTRSILDNSFTSFGPRWGFVEAMFVIFPCHIRVVDAWNIAPVAIGSDSHSVLCAMLRAQQMASPHVFISETFNGTAVPCLMEISHDAEYAASQDEVSEKRLLLYVP